MSDHEDRELEKRVRIEIAIRKQSGQTQYWHEDQEALLRRIDTLADERDKLGRTHAEVITKNRRFKRKVVELEKERDKLRKENAELKQWVKNLEAPDDRIRHPFMVPE